jgi:hypothetical protein
MNETDPVAEVGLTCADIVTACPKWGAAGVTLVKVTILVVWADKRPHESQHALASTVIRFMVPQFFARGAGIRALPPAGFSSIVYHLTMEGLSSPV